MSKSDESLQKLLQELTERINILISDRNSLIKENNYLRAIFCIDQEEKLPSFSECDERWNKITENKWEQEKRIIAAETALTGSLLLINAIHQLQYMNPDSNFSKLVHSAHELIITYDTKYK